MFLVPLNQIESVQLVIHALRAAGGEADCSVCPASRVCMKQCLAIAGSVQRMLQEGQLPMLREEPEVPTEPPPPQTPAVGNGPQKRLKVVK